jgi:hypothetical protein
MSRNILHKSRLPAFIKWLDAKGIAHRPPRGDYQVLQILVGTDWCCIFDRIVAPEHYTNDRRLDNLIRRFIKETRI